MNRLVIQWSPLLAVRARRVGRSDLRLGSERRCVRVLQQRLGGLRDPEHSRSEGAAWLSAYSPKLIRSLNVNVPGVRLGRVGLHVGLTLR
jgi:hypothetical protein